jgi:hypothetical protein
VELGTALSLSVILAQLSLYHLTGPDGQPVEINPDHVVSIRPPRGTDHFTKGVNCLVFTADGKYQTTVETCPQVQAILGGAPLPTAPPNKQ